MTRCAAYLRISKDGEGLGLGIDRQRQAVERLAASKGWTIDPRWVVVENSTSAWDDTKPRPGFERLLGAMGDGRVEAVVLYSFDRLARRLKDTARVLDVVEKQGVQIATVTGDLDLSSAFGRGLAGILGSLAAMEVSQMSERLKAKAEQNARAGKVVNGGRRRYGYTPDRSALVEDEADVIRDVARRLIAGDSLSGLVKRLNGQGARTSYGALWSAKKLRTVMQHDALCGRVVFRGERLHGVKGEWPTILTEEEFDRVQVALQARRRIHDHWTVDRVHLLSGLARCGIDGCDGKMIGYKQTSGVLTYTCSVRKHLSRDMRRLDEFVLSEVKARAADTYFPVPEWVDEDQSRIRQEIADLQERKASSVRDLVEKRITSETLGAVVAEFDARISNLEARQVDAVVNRQVESIVFDLDRIEALPVNDQRAAVELFVERLIVHPVKKRGRGFDPTAVELVWRDLARLQWHAVVEK